MIPFLKKKDEKGLGQEQVAAIDRKPDDPDEEEYGMLDAISEDLIDAASKKDKKLMKSALEALCDYIRDEDIAQDQDEYPEP